MKKAFPAVALQSILLIFMLLTAISACNSGSSDDNPAGGDTPANETTVRPTIILDSVPDKLTVTDVVSLSATIVDETGQPIDIESDIPMTYAPAELYQVESENRVRAVKAGILTVTASFQDMSASKQILISSHTERPVPQSLSTRMADHVKDMNVLMLTFLPTADGRTIDQSQAPNWGHLIEKGTDEMLVTIEDFSNAGKYMLEEGSRFRGYADPTARPYLGYKVLRHIVVYEQIPVDTEHPYGSPFNLNGQETRAYQPDYNEIFSRFSLLDYIEENDIKEVWIWYGEHAQPNWPSYDSALHSGVSNHVTFVESNMSSPSTPDVSNSYRQITDLPVLDHTYVVYGHNIWRTQNQMVHNHGHQLESIYKFIANRQDGSENLFVVNFSGWGPDYSWPPLGRAGDTHHPVNTTVDYDYTNPTMVESDIEDWTPAGTGEKKLINNEYWASLPYNWPTFMQDEDLSEPAWYVYWMQNMPGFNNSIPWNDEGAVMTNWWEFTADWDGAIQRNLGLHE